MTFRLTQNALSRRRNQGNLSYYRPSLNGGTTITVSGGTNFTFDEHTYSVFTSSGSLVISGGVLNVEILALAGGGGGANGGGSVRGGGGGAGGLTVFTASLAGSNSVVIGAGGSPGSYGAQNGDFGSGTSVAEFYVSGGGGGGRDNYFGNWANGNPGGSGGGGGGYWTSTAGGSGLSGQGNEGGPGYGGGNAGGGGGAGSAGSNPDGGFGLELADWHIGQILNATVWLGEGGGGANGGSGHYSGGTGGTGGSVGSDAAVNTGSGGGGGYGPGGNTPGGNGSSGVVIVRYLTSALNIEPPSVSGGVTSNDGEFYYTAFPSSGTLTVTGGNLAAEVLVVAGGGGGANGYAGGGGAGGLIYNPAYVIPAGAHSVVVGAGGSSWLGGGYGAGYNGNNSTFGTIETIGGGYGGIFSDPAGSGGSGGGSGWSSGPAGSGTPGQGWDGAAYVYQGGGGGGVGGPGSGYDGGPGTDLFGSWGIATGLGKISTGNTFWFAAGGNSETSSNTDYGRTPGWSSAQPNTGCGGAGNGISAASGGSGVVILKYPMSSVSSVQ